MRSFALSIVTLLLGLALAGCATRPKIDLSENGGAMARVVAGAGTPSFNRLNIDAASASRILANPAIRAIAITSATDDFKETSAYCQLILSNFESRAETMRWVAFTTAMVGTVAGAVIVPHLVAQSVVNKAAVASWSGLSGATNAAQGYLRSEGLDAQAQIETREQIRVKVLAAIEDYGKAVKSGNALGMSAAVTQMFAACHYYAIASASAILNPVPTTRMLSPDPVALDFGSVTVNQTKNLTVKIRSVGNAAVTLTEIAITDPAGFDPVQKDCTDTLAANAQCTVTVTFHPTKSGKVTTQLKIESNADTGPLVVDLTGTGG